MDEQEFSNACYEVLEILKSVKKEDVTRIPKEEIQMLKKNANYNYNFHYNPDKNIKEQEVSKLAKGIIAQYFCKYIATDKQKEKIKLKQKHDLQIIEEEKYKKEDYSKLFNRNQYENKKEIENTKNVLPIEYKKEKWYIKIFNKLRHLYGKA